jgi:proteasome lid subunit RPN8/RPN11
MKVVDSLRSFTRVTLPNDVADRMIAHAREAAPQECCGLLVGNAGAVWDAVPTTNVSAVAGHRYQIDPVEHFAVIRRARAQALDVIGAYHSHPSGPPVPSRTDLTESFGAFLFVIVGLAPRTPRIAAWERIGGNFVPVTLVRTG